VIEIKICCRVVFPSKGDLAQLAVARDARRRGIATRLFRQAQTLAGKPLRILNVDDRDAGIAAFLEHAGAAKTVRQYEMIKRL
jgi:ribosomal protein S18 acetylase RimI-like enzyme